MAKIEDKIIFKNSNVYEEALARIENAFYFFDTLVVAFSGWKDSLVCLHLLREFYQKKGIKKKVNVVFRDEELIPDDVIEFVEKYRQEDWIDMLYFATPLESEKYILGKKEKYIQWDPNRKHLRKKPIHSISFDRIFSQYDMDEVLVNYFKGKIGVITGVRTSESLIRLQSIMMGGQIPYIANTKSKRVSLVKPIYDWQEDDVFKYFFEKKISYCRIYDFQNVNGEGFRVSTPLHAESSKKFGRLRTLYPTYYQQLVSLFPEMILQERYYKDFDQNGIMDKYEISWRGLYNYIEENLPMDLQKIALKKFGYVKTTVDKLAKQGVSQEDSGYRMRYLFKCLLTGAYKRNINPQKNEKKK